jgi:hypothetical protein
MMSNPIAKSWNKDEARDRGVKHGGGLGLFRLEAGRSPPSGGGRERGENTINFITALVRVKAVKSRTEDSSYSIALPALTRRGQSFKDVRRLKPYPLSIGWLFDEGRRSSRIRLPTQPRMDARWQCVLS